MTFLESVLFNLNLIFLSNIFALLLKALKEKDDLIRSLREDLDKARVQSASIQTKLDEEKK